MPRTAVMFDLDGTLADTLADIAAAGNAMLESFGQPPRPLADYRYLAGQGIDYLVEHGLRGLVDAAMLARGVALVRAHYAQHHHALARPYPGIAELLDALVERGVTLAVLTNKPHDASVELVQRVFARWPFALVRGAQPGMPLKPVGALRIAQELSIAAEQWLYVGDTDVDMTTGKSAGMFTVGATWGFRDEAELRAHGADAIVHEPMELIDYL